MTLEEYQRDVFQKLERFVNIQNQRNELIRDFFKNFKIPAAINHTVTVIETKWIALSIIIGSIIIAGAIRL